jgi:hypothetical protein
MAIGAVGRRNGDVAAQAGVGFAKDHAGGGTGFNWHTGSPYC